MALHWGGTWMWWPLYLALEVRQHFTARIKPGFSRSCPRLASESWVNFFLEAIPHQYPCGLGNLGQKTRHIPSFLLVGHPQEGGGAMCSYQRTPEDDLWSVVLALTTVETVRVDQVKAAAANPDVYLT